jgi:hypothetical protein
VRACLFIPTAVVVFGVLYVVTGTLVEGGHEGVGNAVGLVDFAVLIGAIFLGPVWVLRAWRPPSPPRNEGGPGGDGPLPTPDASDAGGGTRSIGPLDEVDEEIRSLLDQESVSTQRR